MTTGQQSLVTVAVQPRGSFARACAGERSKGLLLAGSIGRFVPSGQVGNRWNAQNVVWHSAPHTLIVPIGTMNAVWGA